MSALSARLTEGQRPIETIVIDLDKACARNTGLLWGFIDLVWAGVPLDFDLRNLHHWKPLVERGLLAQTFSSSFSHDSSLARYMRTWAFACEHGILMHGFKD